MKFTILGSGGSMGVPAAGGFWGECDPDEPKNDRTRASLLVQSDKTNLLIDATCDIRIQLNRIKLQKLDGILVTHCHSDHVNGIDDIRTLSFGMKKEVGIYSTQKILDEIEIRFPHIFNGCFDMYDPIATREPIGLYGSFSVNDIDIHTFEQEHLTCKTVGYRFGDFAYSVDICDMDDDALDALRGVKTWVVDAHGYNFEGESTHANFEKIFKWVDILKPEVTYLTVLNNCMDYKTLCDELPPHIRPTYDGLVIEV